MRKHFLVGNFLPAYSGAFRHPPTTRSPAPSLSPERLALRFDERARRHVERVRTHAVRFQVGLVAAIGLIVVVVRLDLWAGPPTRAAALQEQELVAMEEILQTRQFETPPPPPRPPIPVEVPDEVPLADAELDLDASLDVGAAVASLPPPPPEATLRLPQVREDEIFVVVEEMPEMVGGLAALVRTLDYPELARKAGLEGTVVVQVIVGGDGVPSDPQVIRSVSAILDAEAVRAVMLQTFKPGRQRGRAVRVSMNIPVRFQLA